MNRYRVIGWLDHGIRHIQCLACKEKIGVSHGGEGPIANFCLYCGVKWDGQYGSPADATIRLRDLVIMTRADPESMWIVWRRRKLLWADRSEWGEWEPEPYARIYSDHYKTVNAVSAYKMLVRERENYERRYGGEENDEPTEFKVTLGPFRPSSWNG